MSDGDIPQHDPDPDPERAAAPSSEGPANGFSESSEPSPQLAGDAQPQLEPQPDQGAIEAPSPPDGHGAVTGRPSRRIAPPRTLWAAVAALCVAAGAAGSVLGAHALAGHDEAQSRQNFHLSVTSTGIASTVRVALQREEDLLAAAGTFCAGNPKTSPAELSSWARGANALRRYPELQRLGFVALLKSEPALATPPVTTATTARGFGRLTPASSSRVTSLRPPAAAKPSYYCSAVAQLSRSSTGAAASGGGHCSLSHGLLSARDSGLSAYSAHAGGKTLGIVTPVYRGGVVPSSVGARRAAFGGWLREVLLPSVVLGQALQGHPQAAAQLRYHAGAANVTFAAGAPSHDAQSVATDLHGGWTLMSFGPAVSTGVLSDAGAL